MARGSVLAELLLLCGGGVCEGVTVGGCEGGRAVTCDGGRGAFSQKPKSTSSSSSSSSASETISFCWAVGREEAAGGGGV